jgi:peptidoglycan/xylan/chitin deacetylase (PgdA/CDA1 family)
MSPGSFVISLDFELYWGLLGVRSLEEYRRNLQGVRESVDGMLDLFTEYGINATWATVGFLFLNDMQELLANQPDVRPSYVGSAFCPYTYAERSIDTPTELHFAPEVISKIVATSGQELGTHTFSHFNCLRKPRNIAAFRSDMQMAVTIARDRFGARLTSLVFPGNQYSAEELAIAHDLGITAYRGNPRSPIYEYGTPAASRRLAAIARLADSYVPLVPDLSFRPRLEPPGIVNVQASRFLRPWSPAMALADPLQIRRITHELQSAAERGRDYHLWWHPHNFGRYPPQNLRRLRRILEVFASLRRSHDMQSRSMADMARIVSAA